MTTIDFPSTRPWFRPLAGLFVEWLDQIQRIDRGRSASSPSHALSLSSTPSSKAGEDRRVEASDIQAARCGDGEAFRRIIEQHQQTIAVQMRRFTRDVRELESLTQDVFVEAFLSLPSFREQSPFEHWLRKIAVRVGYRFWKAQARARTRQTQLSDEQWRTVRDSAAAPLTSTNAAELVHELLALLPPADRLVLTLIYLDGCSMSEAAERAGWTTIATRIRASRARQKLRELIEPALIEIR